LEEVRELARRFVQERVVPREYAAVRERLEWHRSRGDWLVIVSGGFAEYLREYAGIRGFSEVVANELEVRDGKLTGKIQGDDCMHEEKVRRLRSAVPLERFDLTKGFVYSDCESDLPLFQLVGRRFVVASSEHPKW